MKKSPHVWQGQRLLIEQAAKLSTPVPCCPLPPAPHFGLIPAAIDRPAAAWYRPPVAVLPSKRHTQFSVVVLETTIRFIKFLVRGGPASWGRDSDHLRGFRGGSALPAAPEHVWRSGNEPRWGMLTRP